jgi:hypothetical protein
MEYFQKKSSVKWLADKITNEITTCGKISPKLISIFTDYALTIHKKECKESYYESLLSNFQTFEHYYEQTFGEDKQINKLQSKNK